MKGLLKTSIVAVVAATLAFPIPPAPRAQSAPAAGSQAGAKSFQQAELDQLLAPVALYPDDLLAQVLMASTYPIEIALADRWVKANPSLKGKALEDALQGQTWDPAVKSLAVLPQVLAMMSEKLDWTQKLGDAFLAQPEDVMSTIQALRAKAVAQGTLKDTNEQKVVTTTEGSTTIIKIVQADPEVIYVPVYDPSVVYGSWWWPAYPPYYYYPPGYYGGGALLGFTAGIIIGAALWGNLKWATPYNVDINVNRYNNFNRSNISDNRWGHHVEHRGAVPYRDQRVAQQYGRGPAADAGSRDAFRGRGDGGLQATPRSPTAFDTGRSAQTRDYSNRGNSSMGAARSSGNFGGARAGGGARGGGGGGGRGGGGRR
jgi:hypothetical protein